jgi:hypothetical protein
MFKFNFFRGIVSARIVNLEERLTFLQPRYPRTPIVLIPYPENYETPEEKKILFENKNIYLTKVFDPSSKVNKISKDKIEDKSETIIIPSYFILPEIKCDKKYAKYFWLFDDKYAYATLELAYCDIKGNKNIKIFVKKEPSFDEIQYFDDAIVNKTIKLKDYYNNDIEAFLLPHGDSKTLGKIYYKNYFGRQLKNLGDLSMAYEASMKGIGFLTQDVIAASYYILFNFYKYMQKTYKFELDIKNYDFGKLILYNN